MVMLMMMMTMKGVMVLTTMATITVMMIITICRYYSFRYKVQSARYLVTGMEAATTEKKIAKNTFPLRLPKKTLKQKQNIYITKSV